MRIDLTKIFGGKIGESDTWDTQREREIGEEGEKERDKDGREIHGKMVREGREGERRDIDRREISIVMEVFSF